MNLIFEDPGMMEDVSVSDTEEGELGDNLDNLENMDISISVPNLSDIIAGGWILDTGQWRSNTLCHSS